VPRLNFRPIQREPMLSIFYECPECGYQWEEEHTSACDSECGECGEGSVEAYHWEEQERPTQRIVYPPTP
jgi:DNA-directed RNA polymerase subunit M/transcription elongation factor TFIIS